MKIIHIIISIGAIIASIGFLASGTGGGFPFIIFLFGVWGLYMIFTGKMDWYYKSDDIEDEIEFIEDQIRYIQKQDIKGKSSEEILKAVDDEVALKIKLKDLKAKRHNILNEE
tara:strand:- start:358 stop:696 length:339 start_codon:yes stop_codon:yes gene_type:complete